MDFLTTFATQFSFQWNAVPKKEIIQEIQTCMEASCIACSYNCDVENVLKEMPKAFGIYAFMIQMTNPYKSIEELEKDWNIDGFEKYPKIVKSRYEKAKTKDDWFTFYIGKSENIHKRVKEHLIHSPKNTTYGLKLKERKKFLTKNQLKVGYWVLPEMPTVDKAIKQFIITNLERKLRDHMLPWVGKQ